MDVDLGKTKFKFTIREVVLLFTFIGGLVSHVIRTEVQNETLTSKVAAQADSIAAVKQELKECQEKIARR